MERTRPHPVLHAAHVGPTSPRGRGEGTAVARNLLFTLVAQLQQAVARGFERVCAGHPFQNETAIKRPLNLLPHIRRRARFAFARRRPRKSAADSIEKGRNMNTNRGSYMLGAALGSALVLTLCVKAHAADIYEAPPAQVVEAPPPPPPSTEAFTSRAISARPTRTSGASGPKATTPTTPSRCSTTTSRAPAVRPRHRLAAQPLAALRSHGRVSWRRPLRRSATGISSSARGTNEYTADIKSWLGLANAYIDLGYWRGFTPYVGAGIGFATISVNGLRGHQHAAGAARSTAPITPRRTLPGRCTPARATTCLRHSAWISPTATPISAMRQERRSHRLRRLELLQRSLQSRTSPRTICCWASATSCSVRLRSTP